MRLPAMAVATLLAGALEAQERPVRWRLDSAPAELRVAAGGTLQIRVAATIDEGWKLYSLDPQKGGPIATKISSGDPALVVDSIAAPPATEYPDRNFNIFTFIYTDTVRFDVRLRAAATAKPGRATIPILVSFQTCTRTYCLPPRTDTLGLPLVITRNASAAAVAHSATTSTTDSAVVVNAAPAVPPAELVTAFTPPSDFASLGRFIWLALSMGLLSLLTPCVLPMIPITVSYFGGAEANRRARTRAAMAHAGGIVVAFTAIGFLVATLLGAGGVTRLAANPALNLAIAALFIVFALNLAGMFEITLPQRVLAAASRAGGGDRHATGALLMGAAFAITSFTCTVPFVGTLLVLATQGSWAWPLIGLAVYGLAFALPFFALAFAPAALQRLPRGGDWMITLKRSLAIAEVALALKFLSNADLVLGTNVLTREVMVAAWAMGALAITALCARAALTAMSASTRAPMAVAFNGALAVVMAVVAVALGNGTRGKSMGELEAYLPPRPELSWILNDYSAALTQARVEGRPVLLDFTGYTCTNCRWMEANMFPRPEIARQLDRFVRARLYTDGLGEPYLTQQRLQLDRFGTVALPYYAVIDPTGAPRATFLGMTRESEEFLRFLTHGLGGEQP